MEAYATKILAMIATHEPAVHDSGSIMYENALCALADLVKRELRSVKAQRKKANKPPRVVKPRKPRVKKADALDKYVASIVDGLIENVVSGIVAEVEEVKAEPVAEVEEVKAEPVEPVAEVAEYENDDNKYESLEDLIRYAEMDIIALEAELLTFDELEAMVIEAEARVEEYVAEPVEPIAEVEEVKAEPVAELEEVKAEPVAEVEEVKAELEEVEPEPIAETYPENMLFSDSLSSDEECDIIAPPPRKEAKERPAQPSEDAVWFESLDTDGEGHWHLPPPPTPAPSPVRKKEIVPVPRVMIHPTKKTDPVDEHGNPIFMFP